MPSPLRLIGIRSPGSLDASVRSNLDFSPQLVVTAAAASFRNDGSGEFLDTLCDQTAGEPHPVARAVPRTSTPRPTTPVNEKGTSPAPTRGVRPVDAFPEQGSPPVVRQERPAAVAAERRLMRVAGLVKMPDSFSRVLPARSMTAPRYSNGTAGQAGSGTRRGQLEVVCKIDEEEEGLV